MVIGCGTTKTTDTKKSHMQLHMQLVAGAFDAHTHTGDLKFKRFFKVFREGESIVT